MGTQTGSIDMSSLYNSRDFTQAQLQMKVDAVADTTDLVSNINAIADRINLLADYITFSPTSGTSVLDELQTIKNSVVIDTDPTNPSVTIGDANQMHVKVTNNKLSFFEGNQEVAYISGQRLYITQSVVLDEMQLGNNKWSWKYDDRDDSIFLKWIG